MVRRAEVIRTCVGCRQRASAAELLRVVAVSDSAATGFRLVPDPRRELPGRGAHVHPETRCMAQAVRKRAFKRALRLPTAPAVDAVESYVTSDML